MAITESDRRDLYTGLERSIGSKEANNLMQLLPTEAASSLATRDDMHANTTMLQGEMAELRGDLRGEMAELRGDLRGEMTELRGELRGEMAALRGENAELRGEMNEKFGMVEARFGIVDEKFAELRVEMSTRFDQQLQWMIGLLLMVILAVVGSSIGVVMIQGA